MSDAPPDLLNDARRLDAIRDAVLHEPTADEAFDRLARIATAVLRAPVSLVTVVLGDRQVLKGCVGLPEPWASGRETPLTHSFCQHVLGGNELVVGDARQHPLVRDSLAIPEMNVVAYAGVPLTTESGHTLGSFCVIDGQPRQWTEHELALLRDLGMAALTEIQLRAAVRRHRGTEQTLLRLEKAVETMQLGVTVTDPEGRIVYTNPAEASMHGWTPEELLGKPGRVLAPRSMWRPAQLPRMRGSWSRESLNVRRDGTVFPVALWSDTVTGPGGELLGDVTCCEDLSARRRGEEEVRSGEARFRQLTEHLSEVFFLGNAELTQLLYVNPAFETVWGRSCEGLIAAPSSLYDTVVPEDRARFTADLRALREGTGLSSNGYRIVRPDGETRWVDCRFFPVLDAEGRVASLAALAADVTERVRAQEALRRSAEHFRTLIESSSDLVCILDGDATLRYVSPSAERVLGYAPEELAGTALSARVHPDDRAALAAVLGELAAHAGGSRSAECRMLHADGSWRAMESLGRNLLHDPAVAGIVVNSRDVTGRRDAEAELRRTRDELEERVEARTRELAEAARRLQRSESRMRAIFAGSALAIVVLDAQGGVVDANPAFASLVGSPAGGVRGLRPGRHLHPGDRAQVTRAFAEVMRGERAEYRGEVRWGGGGDAGRWVRIALSPVDGAGGDRPLAVAMVEDVTERRREREARRLSEERFRQLFQGVPVGVYRLDAGERVVEANPALVRMLGYPDRTALLGTGMGELYVDPEDRARWRRAIASGVLMGFEVRSRRRDGCEIWVHDTVRAVRGADGVLAGYEGVLEDITASREMQAALLRSEQDYRGLFENAHDAILIFDPVGERVLEANARACALYGYAHGELVGRSLLEISVRPELDIARVHQTLETDGYVSFHTLQRRSDGVEMRLEVNATTIRYRDRPAILSINRDVTDRHRAEEALRTSEARFRAVFESSAAGMALLNPEGRPVETNRALREMLGVSAEELACRPLADLAHPADRAEAEAPLAAVLAGRRDHFATENRYLRRDGTLTWGHLTVSSVRDGAGRPRYAVAIVENVTERKEAEEALLASEERLRHSQKMEAVGRLAGGVAHDFNNLLMAIMSHTYTLVRDCEPDDPRRWSAEEIQRAAERAAALTRQLLAFSRKQVLQPAVLDLNAVVGELQSMAQRLLGEDIELRTRLDPALDRVRADRSQAEQVIMNLLVNARDAMPHGGCIHVSTGGASVPAGGELPAGDYATVTVRDEGQGMDRTTRERAFEPFFTTKEVGKGTGLGLSTVYGIVRQSGGWIRVESEPGRGATFTVAFPRVLDGAVGAPAPPAGHLPSGAETVLLVEDESAVRMVVRGILQGCGYTVLEAADGQDALRTAEGHPGPIDLLLTDVVMPRMGGRELASRLRARTPGLRVLFMSGYAGGDDGEMEGDDTAFVQKPLQPDALARRVRALLDAGAAL